MASARAARTSAARTPVRGRSASRRRRRRRSRAWPSARARSTGRGSCWRPIGFSIRPEAPRHRLVDDDDAGRPRAIAIAERPAAGERDADRREVAGLTTCTGAAGRCAIGRGGSPAIENVLSSTIEMRARIERQPERHRRRLDARSRAQPSRPEPSKNAALAAADDGPRGSSIRSTVTTDDARNPTSTRCSCAKL